MRRAPWERSHSTRPRRSTTQMRPNGRRGECQPRGLRGKIDPGGRGPLRRGRPEARRQAGDRRSLIRRVDDSDPRGSRAVRGIGRGRSGAVQLTYEQFRYAFANAVSEEEARELYSTFAVPAPGEPLFQAAFANFNPWTEAKVDTKNPDRGPLLIMDGELDHTVPWAIANASYKQQKRNEGVTEILKVAGRGHALTIDSGWRDVADSALAFVRRFVEPRPAGQRAMSGAGVG